MTEIEEKYLPNELLQKAIVSGKEFGWKRDDFKDVLKKDHRKWTCNSWRTSSIQITRWNL